MIYNDERTAEQIPYPIREREDELFREWKLSRQYECFVFDGAPNPSAYLASTVKTVVMLKDPNALDARDPFDLREELATEPNIWWRTVASWCAGMTNLSSSPSLRWSDLERLPIKESLAPFAFMQMKKCTGGGSVTPATLIKYARQDADNIRAQLRIYQPDVIVGCGTGRILAEVLEGCEWRETEKGVWYAALSLDGHRPTYLIHYMHPSAYGTWKNVVCYGLLDAYREVVATHSLGARVPS
jgi:hypothetical protein